MKLLQISVEHQSLVLRDKNDRPIFEAPISTSKFGLGPEEGSYKTPLGRFRVCEKYGSQAAPYTVFKGRKPVDLWSPDTPSDEDLVLTRIIRLEGLEEDNANTYQRYIYLHGTNQETFIGSQSSHGCIRLRNKDICELFPLIQVGDLVSIL